MGRYVLKRLAALVPTLFVIISVSFFIIRLAPGSPFSSEKAVSEEVLADLESKYGFDQPLHIQWLRYMGNVCKGDLGLSTKYPQRSVNEIIGAGFPVTLALGGMGLAWALVLGFTAGIVGAIKHNSAWDHTCMALAMVGISVPTFVLGPLLVLIFSLHLWVLPPAGWGDFRHVVLPGLTLGTVYAGYISRLTRGGLLEITRLDFIRTAKAKGLSKMTVVVRHMLKGGLVPVVTFLGPAVAHLLVGSVVIEKIFNIPGIGPYFVDAAFNRDYFLVMGIVVLESVFLLAMNFLVDITYAFLDPRISLS